MKQRLLSRAVLLFFLVPQLVLAANFSDVPEAHPAATAILSLKEAGLVSGYGDGTFKPDQPVSRAETLAMVLKAASITVTKTSQKVSFTDVAETDWFFPMVQKGVGQKKLKGYGDKTFRPGNPVTLPEALAMMFSFFSININAVDVEPTIYAGFDSNAWYAKAVQHAKNRNIIIPEGNGQFDVAKPLTRGELAILLFRLRTTQQTAKPFDITSGWKETQHLTNFWKFRHPADWEIFQGTKNSVIWKRAPHQVFFSRIWPESAKLAISLVEPAEPRNAAQYFYDLKQAYLASYAPASPSFHELTLGERQALKIDLREERFVDLVVALPSNKFLVVHGEYGKAPIGEWHRKELESMVMSYQYVEPPVLPPKPVIPLEQRMETLRTNMLIAKGWKVVLPLFPDKKLIHTDAIGVGTGPVDYFYSKEAGHTIKLERNSETILNIREGETSAF